MRTTTRNLEMKANIAILYVGQLERWRSNLQRKLLVLVACVFVDLDAWALQLVLLIRGVSDLFIMTAALSSDRSFTGPFLPALFRVRYQCPLYLLLSSEVSLYV